MQHFVLRSSSTPANTDAERAAHRRAHYGEPPLRQAQDGGYEIEQHRVEDEPDATADWLAHIATGRIPVR